jgi:hypothetical protein
MQARPRPTSTRDYCLPCARSYLYTDVLDVDNDVLLDVLLQASCLPCARSYLYTDVLDVDNDVLLDVLLQARKYMVPR